MSLKQKETKFKPRMKLNHNIYKNSLNKFCSQKDFVSRVIHSCVSSWLFFRVYKEIRKELNKSEPTLSYVFIRNHFFLNTARLFDTRERFFPFFKLLISSKKIIYSKTPQFFSVQYSIELGKLIFSIPFGSRWVLYCSDGSARYKFSTTLLKDTRSRYEATITGSDNLKSRWPIQLTNQWFRSFDNVELLNVNYPKKVFQ